RSPPARRSGRIRRTTARRPRQGGVTGRGRRRLDRDRLGLTPIPISPLSLPKWTRVPLASATLLAGGTSRTLPSLSTAVQGSPLTFLSPSRLGSAGWLVTSAKELVKSTEPPSWRWCANSFESGLSITTVLLPIRMRGGRRSSAPHFQQVPAVPLSARSLVMSKKFSAPQPQ